MKKILIFTIPTVLTVAVCALSFIVTPVITKQAYAEITCPDGSYEIGRKDDNMPICKLEPTGCPYGDSIPLGELCDKFAPKTPDDSALNPNRDYYDANSQKYTYDGKPVVDKCTQ